MPSPFVQVHLGGSSERNRAPSKAPAPPGEELSLEGVLLLHCASLVIPGSILEVGCQPEGFFWKTAHGGPDAGHSGYFPLPAASLQTLLGMAGRVAT